MKFTLPPILITLLLLSIAASTYAETRYISDYLIVTVRSGAGNEYKVLETIPTGTPVTIIQDGKRYVKVRTPKGTEGYISRHYVSKALPKTVEIKQLREEIVTLQQQLSEQRQTLNGNQNEVDNYKVQAETLTVQLNQARQKLKQKDDDYHTLSSKAQNVLNLDSENKQLIEENNLINSELLVLREENQNFHRSNIIQWFLAGGGVFLVGWLIGKISRKRQRRF